MSRNRDQKTNVTIRLRGTFGGAAPSRSAGGVGEIGAVPFASRDRELPAERGVVSVAFLAGRPHLGQAALAL